MEYEISLRTSGVHDQDTNTSSGVHSEITIRLDLPGIVTIHDKELLKEGLLELLRFDNAITNDLTTEEFMEFNNLKSNNKSDEL